MTNLYKNILKGLIVNEINFEEMDHTAVYTATAANQLSNIIDGKGIKSIALKVQSKIFILTIRDDERINFHGLKLYLGAKVSFLKVELIKTKLETEIGGLAPFGYNSKIRCFISNRAMNLDFFSINPGVNNKTIEIDRIGFLKLLKFYRVKELPREIFIIKN